jgi:hypothetical protein
MQPFELLTLFLSFVYTLALTHILFASTRMIRHRRRIVFSWPHALWMVNALIVQFDDWLSLSDLRALKVLSLGIIAVNFGIVIIQYLVCALVSPDFESADDYDLRRFHTEQGPTYITAFLVVMLYSMAVNIMVADAGVANAIGQNWIVVLILVPIIAALWVRNQRVQLLAPLVLLILQIAYAVIYYPVLR